MHYWLLKSEPSAWSWQNQLDRGEQGEGWDGVRNYQALNNMKAMAIGDLAFLSFDEKQIVGIVEVCALYHPDPTDASGRFGMVTVKAVKSLHPSDAGRHQADERQGYGTGPPVTIISHAGNCQAMGHHLAMAQTKL